MFGFFEGREPYYEIPVLAYRKSIMEIMSAVYFVWWVIDVLPPSPQSSPSLRERRLCPDVFLVIGGRLIV
jgi:hypothetical protein